MLQKIKNNYNSMSLVAKASIWFVLVTVIDQSISLLTQPLLNRILSVEEVGVYGVYNTWHSLLSVVATLNMFGGVLEVQITKNKKSTKQIVGSLLALSTLSWIIIFGIGFVFVAQFSSLLSLKPIYLCLMSVSILSNAVIQFWSVPKRFEYDYRTYAYLVVGLFLTKSLMSVFLAYFLSADRVMGRIVGMTFPSCVVAIVLVIKIYSHFHTKDITKYWKVGLKFNLPLIPHYLSSILLASSDKVMIQHLADDACAGLYTVAYAFSGLALTVFSALNSAYSPFAYKAIYEKKYDSLKERTNSLILVCVLVAIILILFAPEGLLILGGSEYASTLNIVPILVVGIFFSSFYFLFSNVEFVYEKTQYIFPVTVIGASVNILLNFLLIPEYGYKVAAATTLIGYTIITFLHFVISKHMVEERLYDYKTILIYVILLVSVAIVSTFLYSICSIYRYIMIAIASVVLVAIIYKKDLLTKL